MTKAILIDINSFDHYYDQIVHEIRAAKFVGLDTEGHDDARHDGLMHLCGYDAMTRKKSPGKKLVFDMRRIVMCGFSLHAQGSEFSYYINLNHADVENRLPWEKAKLLLDALPDEAHWVAHNAPFEITIFKSVYDYDLPRIICTLQMAVSAYGPDEYDPYRFARAPRGAIGTLIPALIRESATWDPSEGEDSMSPALAELMMSVIAKQSQAAHSYNGYIYDLSYGYGLKKLVKSFFDYDMTTFEECLGGKAHMGQLTAAETVEYGADDAYWAIRVYERLLEYMMKNCPASIEPFFTQENPMIHIYADIWHKGMAVNHAQILARRGFERTELAGILHNMKKVVQALLPFPKELNTELAKNEKWYKNGGAKYRAAIEAWAKTPDTDDPYQIVSQIRGPVTNQWRAERGEREATGPNFSHYMPIRVLLYDLLGEKLIKSDGKVQSDGGSRGRMKDKAVNPLSGLLIDCINKIAAVEQRVKLYITPYLDLTDPETSRMYPVVSSKLATRRLAVSDPNPTQLAKRGESVYVRGFYEADRDDHVVVSIDWSGIELVEIGEFSGDPEFIKAFGQLPHDDLHGGAAADILGADVPGLTEKIFKSIKNYPNWDEFLEAHKGQLENTNRLSTNLKGEPLRTDNAMKYWRTEVGKGANFNYWYSGFLGTVGDRMGWSTEKTGLATERYRERFSVAEKWRTDLIDNLARNGHVYLPDGHRRVRFEATDQWKQLFLDKFQLQDTPKGYNALIELIARKIQKRAYNQGVNAVIQGSCATIMKRSLLRIKAALKDKGWTDAEARIIMMIHDEIVFSVHRKYVAEFINLARGIMIDHPDMFTKCKLDASPSVGLNFQPWHPENAPIGQVELFECPKFDFIPKEKHGSRLNDNEVQAVVDHLFELRRAA